LGVAVLTSAIVVTNIRPAYLRLGLDRRQGMSWMEFYATTAVISGWLALVLLRWPRTLKVPLAVAFVLQFLFVGWVAGHDGACVFGCGPFIVRDNSASPRPAHSAESSRPLVTVYRYTCCATADVHRDYHPGDTVVLHWSAVVGTTPAYDRLVTLGAGLLGPLADGETPQSLAPLRDGHVKVKLAGTHADVTVSTGGAPVTRIVIPTGTPPGYYALETGAQPAAGDPCWAEQNCEEELQNPPLVVRVTR
jgi:hypothetical protein